MNKTQKALLRDIQFNANQMNKSRARVELYKLYKGPALIHLVCIKLNLILPHNYKQ